VRRGRGRGDLRTLLLRVDRARRGPLGQGLDPEARRLRERGAQSRGGIARPRRGRGLSDASGPVALAAGPFQAWARGVDRSGRGLRPPLVLARFPRLPGPGRADRAVPGPRADAADRTRPRDPALPGRGLRLRVAPTPFATEPARRRWAMSARDRIVELVRVRAGELTENPSNWRRHPAAQRAALRGLLQEVGYADALLARRDRDWLVLIDGHLRKSLDPDQVVPVLVLDVSEAEADKLLVALDPLAALARPDPEALSRLLGRVGTESDGLADLFEGLAREARAAFSRLLASPEEIPEEVEPRTRPGDLFLVGAHRLLCGDARRADDLRRLMGQARADLLLTDPPYGVGYVGKTPRALRIRGDEATGLRELLRAAFSRVGEVLRAGAPIYLFSPAGELSVVFAQAFVAQGWRLHQTLVWVKDAPVLGHADYHYRHEPILYGYVPSETRRGR